MVTVDAVRRLREETGAGVMDAKRALDEAAGDFDKAKGLLRERGMAAAAKRSERETGQGVVESYIHGQGRIGALVELNCETDFVARNDEFQKLARDVAMHIAAANPLAVSAEGLPQDVVEREKQVYLETVKNEGKPEKMWDKIVEGKLGKFYKEMTLMDQIFVKDPEGKKTINDLVTEAGSKMGENIVVRRFSRFAVGD